MKFAQDEMPGKFAIRSYESGRITVNDKVYEESIIVMPDRIIEDWQPQEFSELTGKHFLDLVKLEPELILLGTGPVQRFPAQPFISPIMEQGIGLEVMDTGAACRTYNLLLAEGRHVLAALLCH